MNLTTGLGILLFSALVAMPCLAQISINGRVLSESGKPLPGAVIQAGEQSTATDAAGRFILETGSAEIFTLHYSAENHFPIIHSYSALEIEWLGGTGPEAAVTVPDVTLVEHANGRVMLLFGGDAMMGRRYSQADGDQPALIRKNHRAEDTRALLQHIKPYLEVADFASVNLESQVMESEPEQKAPKSYVFFTPPEAVGALKDSGIDYVTLGNNHTYDYLATGLESTLNSLDAYGLPYSGAGMTEDEALRPFRVNIRGNRMSFLGFLGWAGNFTPNQVAQGDAKGGAAFGTADNIRTAVSHESTQGRLPVVQYHGSREYTEEPTLVTESRLKQAIDDGAVLAIGHHPHVVQGFEIYKERLIAYSMGNFMFDQFHYSTKRSYLLYVWMDGDLLHRAEVAPLRIKGYVPMPATDTFRQAILRRVRELSGRRGVSLAASGGNAVILAQSGRVAAEATPPLVVGNSTVNGTTSIMPLHDRAWNQPVEMIEAYQDRDVRVRLGKNLLPMGHLESHDLFAAADRSWIADGSQTIVDTEGAPSGRNVMQLQIPAGAEEGRIGMRTFEYTFEPGTPSTLMLTAKTAAPAMVTAYQQWRKRDQNRTEALENAKLRVIGQQQLGADDWQTLRFDFDSPRVSAISYRVILVVEPMDSSEQHVSWFDDIALIEWLSPPLNPGAVPAYVQSPLASHVEVSAH